MERITNSNKDSTLKMTYKRKADEGGGGEECKKIRKVVGSDSDSPSLLMFSDDILLMVIQNLDHHSVLSLSRSCERLHVICQDHTLWRRVDFGVHPVSAEDLQETLKYVDNDTDSVSVKGTLDEEVLKIDWLLKINEKCKNLQRLAVPEHKIDCRFIDISQFPKALRYLDLSNVNLLYAPSTKSYFKDISVVMPGLEVLILSNCQWFEPHSLMALSKCPRLSELRLNGCTRIKDCVAYCGLATRGGFKALQTLDLRRCPIGSSELVCFASVPTIINLYLENPFISGQFLNVFIDAPIMILFTKEPMIEIRADGNRGKASYPRLKIQRLVVRHYKKMTDVSLSHLARDAFSLRYLDVTGCGITHEAVERFKALRPSVTIVNDIHFDTYID